MAFPIKIKLDLNKLRAINLELSQSTFEPTNTRTENVERAILRQVAKKLAQKQLNVFPNKKEFSFKLEYYEADKLEAFLRLVIDETGVYIETYLLSLVADEINQKLA